MEAVPIETTTTDPKMMLLCLLTIPHVYSQLVNAESKAFYEEDKRHSCSRKQYEAVLPC